MVNALRSVASCCCRSRTLLRTHTALIFICCSVTHPKPKFFTKSRIALPPIHIPGPPAFTNLVYPTIEPIHHIHLHHARVIVAKLFNVLHLFVYAVSTLDKGHRCISSLSWHGAICNLYQDTVIFRLAMLLERPRQDIDSRRRQRII